MARRNRVIYQSQALFIAPSSTGAQVSGVTETAGTGPLLISSSPFGPSNTGELASGVSLLKKMDRIQSCNFNFTLNRQDINEFGKLARIDTLVTEPPTVGLDFSYFVTDGLNERLMGFNFTGKKNGVVDEYMNPGQSISGLLQDTQGNNFYILTVDDGEDVVGQEDTFDGTNSIVAIGNGFVTDYSFEAAVGGLPTATVTVEAFNIKTDYNIAKNTTNTAVGDASEGTAGAKNVYVSGYSPAVNLFQTPAVKFGKASDMDKAYKLDYSREFTGSQFQGNSAYNFTGFTTGDSTVSALRPGDITIEFPATSGLSSISGANSAHIQSFNFSIPLTRTILQRLGSVFGYTRVVDVPINMEMSISAVVSELQDANLFDIMADTSKLSFAITLNDTNQTTPQQKMRYEIKGAQLVSETYSEAIGDNQSVDITYTVQLGGANDTAAGVFLSGSYDNTQADEIVRKFYVPGTGRFD